MAKICGLEMAGLIKAKWTMQLDPFLDEDFNVVVAGVYPFLSSSRKSASRIHKGRLPFFQWLRSTTEPHGNASGGTEGVGEVGPSEC